MQLYMYKCIKIALRIIRLLFQTPVGVWTGYNFVTKLPVNENALLEVFQKWPSGSEATERNMYTYIYIYTYIHFCTWAPDVHHMMYDNS